MIDLTMNIIGLGVAVLIWMIVIALVMYLGIFLYSSIKEKWREND